MSNPDDHDLHQDQLNAGADRGDLNRHGALDHGANERLSPSGWADPRSALDRFDHRP
jgi:hypothetical protein